MSEASNNTETIPGTAIEFHTGVSVPFFCQKHTAYIKPVNTRDSNGELHQCCLQCCQEAWGILPQPVSIEEPVKESATPDSAVSLQCPYCELRHFTSWEWLVNHAQAKHHKSSDELDRAFCDVAEETHTELTKAGVVELCDYPGCTGEVMVTCACCGKHICQDHTALTLGTESACKFCMDDQLEC